MCLERAPAPLLFALSLFALAGCMRPDGKAAEAAERPRETPTVRSVLVEERALDRVISVTAELVATHEGVVSARIAGLPIVAVSKERGDRVQAGEELLRLATEDLDRAVKEAELARDEAQSRHKDAEWATKELEAQRTGQLRVLGEAESNARRAEAQAERGALSAEELDKKRFERDREQAAVQRLDVQILRSRVQESLALHTLDQRVAQLEKAKEERERAIVRAPMAGILSERDAVVGSLSTTGTVLYRLFDPASLVGEIKVPQQNLAALAVGQSVRLSSEVMPGLHFHGRLARIAPTIDREAGIVRLEVRFDQQAMLEDKDHQALFEGAAGARLKEQLGNGELFKPGLFLSGEIVLERRDRARTLPRKAIGTLRGQAFYFAMEPLPQDATERAQGATHRVKRRFFTEGLASSGFVEVLARGEDPAPPIGTEAVLVGQDRLRDGDAVRLVQSDQELGSDEGNR